MNRPPTRDERATFATAARAAAVAEHRHVKFKDSTGVWYISEAKFASMQSFFRATRRTNVSCILGRQLDEDTLIAVNVYHIVTAYMA